MGKKITSDWLRTQHPTYAAILDGEFDGEGLEMLEHSIALRKKTMFRKYTKVRLVGTTNPMLDGKLGEVIRVGPKRIAVGVGEKTTDQFGDTYADGTYNMPARMLELVS